MRNKTLKFATLLLVVSLLIQTVAFSHGGRTDSSGGHKDNKNASGLGYYHYHHGYGPHLHTGGSCPYTASSTTTKPSTSTSTTTTTKLKGRLPEFSVFINGHEVDNLKAKYPLFVYNDITYFPMTWNYCSALGLATTYDDSSGLFITKGSDPVQLETTDMGVTNFSTVYISKPYFDITLNGKKIDNDNLQYPVMHYNGVTYFPLTWDFVVNELGWKSEYDGISLKIFSN